MCVMVSERSPWTRMGEHTCVDVCVCACMYVCVCGVYVACGFVCTREKKPSTDTCLSPSAFLSYSLATARAMGSCHVIAVSNLDEATSVCTQ